MNVELENKLKQRFEYDPQIGLIEKGTGAPCRVKHLRFGGLRLRTKNIAWWMHTGQWSEVVRTLDGDYTNLRIDNLTNTLMGEKAKARKEREEERKQAEKRAKKAEREARLAALPPPLVTMYFQNNEWHIRAVGFIRTYKKYKDAKAAMDDFYYTTPELFNK